MHKSFKKITLFLSCCLLALTACRPSPNSPTRLAPTASHAFTPTELPILEKSTETPSPISPTFPAPAATPRPSPTPSPTMPPAPPRTTILFTGNIVPARCVQAKIDATGNADYPYEEIRDVIRGVDLAIGTLNATISDVTVPTGCVNTFLLVGRSANAAALANAGFDAMSVATNHIKNCGQPGCGDQAFLDTLDNLVKASIRPIGAGDNLELALAPQVFEIKGIRFVFISLGELESSTFATADRPGIAVLDEVNLQTALRAAQEMGDVVIALPHWGPEYSLTPNYRQLRFAQQAVDGGADLVVGNHTHTVQTIDLIDGIPVFYGLGNFMFDQAWSRETSQGLALIVTFEGTEFVDYELVPVHTDRDGRVHLADPVEADEILTRVLEASQNIP